MNDAEKACREVEAINRKLSKPMSEEAKNEVIKELNLLRDWIKSGDGYVRDDAPDEISRAIANRIETLKES